MTKGKEKGRSNAPPDSIIYIGKHSYCPTTFNCTIFIGFSVILFTDSRLLSSAMFA